MPWAVHIEFQRVQAYLNAVPRLKDMLGANALLGEAIRIDLPCLALQAGGLHPAAVSLSDPWQPPDDPLDSLSPPLPAIGAIPLADKPEQLQRLGILARDGGHFQALFGTDADAERFIALAESWLQENLPGLRFLATKRDLAQPSQGDPEGRYSLPQSLPDLPAFQVCEDSGSGPASNTYQVQGETRWISRASKARKDMGDAFKRGGTSDLIGLLQPLFPCQGRPFERPNDFDEMCGRDYLAVIYADGNRIGKRFQAWRNSSGSTATGDPVTDHVSGECHGERFYHAMRVSVRRALVDALQRTFAACAGPHTPFQVLMLGGDDLLLACRAPYALDFVVNYARALVAQGKDGRPEGLAPPTIGAGVAIAAANYPFHHLHALAERLAASAKRLERARAHAGLPAVSTVDWMICTESWTDDPIALRRRHDHVRYRMDGSSPQETELVLTARPYPILKAEPEQGLQSLESLLDAARLLAPGRHAGPDRSARSQWRALPAELARGRLWGELHYGEFLHCQPDAVREDMKRLGLHKPWEEIPRVSAGTHALTRVPDLVEVMEIPHLSRAR